MIVLTEFVGLLCGFNAWYRALLVLLLMSLAGSETLAQPQFHFRTYTTEDGLPNNSVRCIVHDQKGFTWLGTVDGLVRFDGHEFRLFQHDPDDTNSLAHNYIYSIFEDKSGLLWIPTFGGGLSRLDPATETFMNYRHEQANANSISSDECIAFFEDSKGNKWLGSGKGLDLFEYNPDAPLTPVIHHFDIDPEVAEFDKVLYITEDDSGFLWLGTTVGLKRFNPETKEWLHFRPHPDNPDSLSNRFVVYLRFDQRGQLWVSTFGGGLNKLSLYDKTGRWHPKFTRFTSDENSGSGLLTRVPGDLVFGPDSTLFISSNRGLFLLPHEEQQKEQPAFQHTMVGNEKDSTLAQHLLYLKVDTNKLLWVGSNLGFSVAPLYSQQIKSFTIDENEDRPLFRDVYAFFENKDSTLWLGTDNGLFQYDLQSRSYLKFPIPEKYEEGGDNIDIIFHDKNNDVWFASDGGLFQIRNPGKASKELFSFPFQHALITLGTQYLNDVSIDEEGNFWFSSYYGILKFNPEKKQFTPFSFDTIITFFDILPEGKDKLILAANRGVQVFDKKTGKFSPYEAFQKFPELKSMGVSEIVRDRQGMLWFGNRMGLIRFDPGKKEYKRFNNKNLLPGNDIRELIMDNEGFIWASTNNGLCRIYPVTFEVFNLSKMDGLTANEMVIRSAYKNDIGYLYFSTSFAFIRFHPDKLYKNLSSAKVVFTGMRLFNEPVSTYPEQAILGFALPQTMPYTDRINLTYEHKVISFEYSAFNYLHPELTTYAYKLEGFDEDWIYAGSKRSVTYTNLDPGKYTLKVKAANHHGVWNEEAAELAIIIAPPWWRTWWAYLLFALAAAGILYAFFRYRLNRQKQKLQEQLRIERIKLNERELMRKKSAEDFHDVNGNKLTKISLYAELAKSGANEQTVQYIRRLEEHVKGLSTGIRDFLWTLDPAKDSLQEMVERLRQFGDELFKHSGSNFKTDFRLDNYGSTKLTIDIRRQILLIFQEAMNNIMKYAGASEVALSVNIKKEMLQIKLEDNGKGFEPSQSVGGYGLANMENRAHRIGGTLQIESLPGKGTCVAFEVNFTHLGDKAVEGNAIALNSKATDHD